MTHVLKNNNLEIQPAVFYVSTKSDKVIISFKSQRVNGYSYELKKEIEMKLLAAEQRGINLDLNIFSQQAAGN